jgi:peptidoglycan/xylan/chitin deacetylase (PgdA/CDA1 family)
MRHPRYWVKDALYGMFYLLDGSQTTGFRAILTYHCVGVNLPWGTSLTIFRKQMAYLKEQCEVVPLRDFRDHASSNGSRALVAITFDDGTVDHYIQALPVLEDLGLKATFFVVTGCIGDVFRGTYYETQAMNERQIRELVSLRHEIGAHTVHHVRLRGLGCPRVLAEMQDSKRQLENLTERPVVSFAYPFGSVDQEALGCAHEAGFRYAVTTHEGLVPEQEVDWWALPRVGVDSTVGMLQFRAKVSRALEAFERHRGRRRPGAALSRVPENSRDSARH